MKKAWLLLLLLPLCLSGCQMQKSPAEEYSRPFVENIKVENYYETGVNREYLSDVPQRVIVIGANETETLLDLGVEEAILAADDGQNSQRYGIKASNEKAFQRLPRIDRSTIQAEHFLEMHPDMIIAEQQFFSKTRLGSTDYWNSKGILTMVPLNTTSPGKLNQVETVEKEMKFIRDLGIIFHKEEEAEKIVSATENRIHDIAKTVAYHKKPKVMILDRMSILASSIGGVVPDTTAAVSDEMMMKLDPDVVFLVVYRDEEKELAWLRNRPAFRHLNFVKNNRLYGIPLKYVYGSQTRTIDAIGYMAECMYPGMFDFPKEYDFHI